MSSLALWMVWGCGGDHGKDTAGPTLVDNDGDGYTAGVDCDDDASEVHPDAVEVYYDGVDGDCDGGDDFDQDHDGHASDVYGGDDCVDQNAAISPGAPEIPYDAVDNDCDPGTPDDDIDGDGFLSLFDCDDNAPTTFPGALDTLGDGVDSDCDGIVDGSRFAFGDLAWIAPGRPRLVVTDDWVALGLTAGRVTSPTYFPDGNDEVGVLLAFDRDAVGGAQPAIAPYLWHGEYDDDLLGDADFAADGSAVEIGTSWFSEVNLFGWLAAYRVAWLGPGVEWQIAASSFASTALVAWAAADVAIDADGVPWVCASDADSVGYLRADGGFPSPAGNVDADGTAGCLVSAPTFTSFDDGGAPTTWVGHPDDADPTPTVAGNQPFTEAWDRVGERDGVITAVLAAGGVRVIDPATGTDVVVLDDGAFAVTDAQAEVEPDGTLWIAAVADRGNGNEVLLAYGAAGALDLHWYTVDAAASYAPIGVSIALTPGRVVLAVSAVDTTGGANDAVGWAFLGR